MIDLEKAEELFVKALPCEKRLQIFLNEIKQAYQSLSDRVATGTISERERRIMSRKATNLNTLSAHFRELERDTGKIQLEAATGSAEIMSQSRSLSTQRTESSSLALQAVKSSQSTQLLRTWFLGNLADPFPSSETKSRLVQQTNDLLIKRSKHHEKALLSYEQCQLWFINGRRRSGWTTFFREYAYSDKYRMHKLIDALQRHDRTAVQNLLPASVPQLAADTKDIYDDCLASWKKVNDWITQTCDGEVGDWMDEIVQQAKDENDSSGEMCPAKRWRVDQPRAELKKKRCRLTESSTLEKGQSIQRRPNKNVGTSSNLSSKSRSVRCAKSRGSSSGSNISTGAMSTFTNSSSVSSIPTSHSATVWDPFLLPQGQLDYINEWAQSTQTQAVPVLASQKQPSIAPTSSPDESRPAPAPATALCSFGSAELIQDYSYLLELAAAAQNADSNA